MSEELVKLGLQNWLVRLRRGQTIPSDELIRGITDAIRALSAPQPCEYVPRDDQSIFQRSDGKLYAGQRKGPVDRRQSATGDPAIHLRRDSYKYGVGYGRRADDRARWEGKSIAASPVPLVDWFHGHWSGLVDNPATGRDLKELCHELDRRLS